MGETSKELGDVSSGLGRMFDSAYSDHKDNTGNVPQSLRKSGRKNGLEVFRVSGCIGRAIEEAPVIGCKENQKINIALY